MLGCIISSFINRDDLYIWRLLFMQYIINVMNNIKGINWYIAALSLLENNDSIINKLWIKNKVGTWWKFNYERAIYI